MAKRVRGTTSRPGQRARLQRGTAARPPVASPTPLPAARPPTLTDEEEARAAELEARILAAERSAEETASRRDRGRRTAIEGQTPGRTGSIALRAADEYAYVSRDLRRVLLIGGPLLGLLLGIWVVVQVTGGGAV
jgi:hypothetical protein